VRLDHLLSKERLTRESGLVARGLRMLGRGARRRRHWLVLVWQRPAWFSTWPLLRGWWWNGVWVRLGWGDKHGTLLGPEGTTVRWEPGRWSGCFGVGVDASVSGWMLRWGCCFGPGMAWSCIPSEMSRCRRVFFGGVFLGAGAGLWVVGWSLVENYTVDASILFCVVKLSRANGGCLGTRSR
jgi:hypothetical protein